MRRRDSILFIFKILFLSQNKMESVQEQELPHNSKEPGFNIEFTLKVKDVAKE